MQTKLINMHEKRFEPPRSTTRHVAGAPIHGRVLRPTQTNDRTA